MSKSTIGRACPYCNEPAQFMESSASLYRGTEYGPVWACLPCEAWVGCHPGTTKPLGRLADRELRRAKVEAHRAFDPLWRAGLDVGATQREARTTAYRWLANALGLIEDDCHIGKFDLPRCRAVVDICRSAVAPTA